MLSEELPADHWLRNASDTWSDTCTFQLLEVHREALQFANYWKAGEKRPPWMNSEELQDRLTRAGLHLVSSFFRDRALESSDILVLRTRTDVFFPAATLKHI